MNTRTYFLGILFGALLIATVLAVPARPALAETCYDAAGLQIPCPEHGKKPTVTPVRPTATGTPTETPTPTATFTPAPSLTPTASKTPVKLCLEPLEFMKCLGNPSCNGLPKCPPTPGTPATPGPTGTSTPIPISLPPQFPDMLGLITVLGGFLGGGYFAARSGVFKRWSVFGHSQNTGGNESGGQDTDNLSNTWEENNGVDLNTDGQFGGDSDVNTSDPPDDSQPLKKP